MKASFAIPCQPRVPCGTPYTPSIWRQDPDRRRVGVRGHPFLPRRFLSRPAPAMRTSTSTSRCASTTSPPLTWPRSSSPTAGTQSRARWRPRSSPTRRAKPRRSTPGSKSADNEDAHLDGRERRLRGLLPCRFVPRTSYPQSRGGEIRGARLQARQWQQCLLLGIWTRKLTFYFRPVCALPSLRSQLEERSPGTVPTTRFGLDPVPSGSNMSMIFDGIYDGTSHSREQIALLYQLGMSALRLP